MNNAIKWAERIVIGISFIIFILVTCYQLTGSALWYDEAIEYWYSKIMFGELPMAGVADGTVNMYQRILLTYQPPLYNIIMFFWLKISDTELWFRLFGVLMGSIGALGIFCSVKKLSNAWIASATVTSIATIFTLNYYWQECAEYCLVLAGLCWTVYFWICLLQDMNLKHMILFTCLAIVSIYSQYGAVFPVFSMVITTYICILLKKDKTAFKQIGLVYITALIFTAFPLFFFFLRDQFLNRQTDWTHMTIPQFPDGVLHDFFDGLQSTFFWTFFSYIYKRETVTLILIVILIMSLISLICGKNKIIKMIITSNVICWIGYYIAVKFAVYSEGFARRHNLFLAPMWILFIVAVCVDFFSILSEIPSVGQINISMIKWAFLALCLGLTGYYTIFNCTGKLVEHSYKSDVRGPVNEWYAQKAYEKSTIVYYAADPGFAYYIRQHDGYDELIESDVTYMPWLRDFSVEEYTLFIDDTYGKQWPKDIYIVASNYMDDLDTLAECFVEKGYERNDLYDLHGGKLVYFSQED